MITTVFSDLDGVLRHWDSSPLHAAEVSHGLNKGLVFQTAFDARLLNPVITGKVSHSDWCEQIKSSLTAHTTAEIAAGLVKTWESSSFIIDNELIVGIKRLFPNARLAIVTNGTSRLSEHLEGHDLDKHFDFIFNSSDIGHAKPSPEFYMTALDATQANANDSVFIDDSASNVAAAKELGFQGIHFLDKETSLKELARLANNGKARA